MKLLILSDISGKYGFVDKLRETTQPFDAIISLGNYSSFEEDTTAFTYLDTLHIILQKLLLFRCPVFCVPGDHDLYKSTHLFDMYGANIQERVASVGCYVFLGWGGSSVFSVPTEEETKDFLSFIQPQIKHPFIFITHNPPYNTALDTLPSGGHGGSPALRSFIEDTKPVFVVCSSLSGGAGKDMIGNSVVFSPGSLQTGAYGVVDITPTTITTKHSFLKMQQE